MTPCDYFYQDGRGHYCERSYVPRGKAQIMNFLSGWQDHDSERKYVSTRKLGSMDAAA